MNSTNTSLVEWDYPENNFTYSDYPAGVLPRYAWILGPNNAYLLNGLPEHTDINKDYNTYVVIGFILQAIIGLLIQGLSFVIVWKNTTVGLTVKWYLLADAYTRINQAFHCFFMAFCSINWFCVEAKGWPVSWLFVNQVWMSITLALNYVSELLANGLSFNRIFAVYFDGRYYKHMEKVAIPQMLLSFIIPLGTHLEMIGAEYREAWRAYVYDGYYFSPLAYIGRISWVKDDYSLWFIFNIIHIGYMILGVTILFDFITLIRIRKLRRATESQAAYRAELRLTAMIVITHLIPATEMGFELLTNAVIFNAITFYFMVDLIPWCFRIVFGLIIIFFMAPQKKAITEAPSSTTGTVNSQRTATSLVSRRN